MLRNDLELTVGDLKAILEVILCLVMFGHVRVSMLGCGDDPGCDTRHTVASRLAALGSRQID